MTGLGNCATSIENMVIGVNANGASISPDPRVARDYSQPVQFTLTAPDGTKVVYTVTVKGAACLSAPTPTPTPTPVPAPVPVPAPTPTPTACTAAAIGSTGYSLVFKGCSAANVAEYYDKTECVRDNASGLIWQGQTPAGTGLRANDQNKTNYDSTVELQKWPSAPTQIEIDAITNSIGFKNAVNASNLCGTATWRLPTVSELTGIVKTSETPTIDNIWFPNTPNDAYYWASSTSVDHAVGVVNFHDGSAITYTSINREYAYEIGLVNSDYVLVRLVR